MQQIYPAVWLSLPKEVKAHLINVFGLVRTGISEIRDQELVSDGFTAEDLMRISHEQMTEYIGSEETFIRAWEITLAKVHAELNPPIATIQNVNGEATAVDIVEDPIQTIESDSVPMVMEIVEPEIKMMEESFEIESGSEPLIVEEKSTITFSPEPVVPPWCNSCSSKGVRHKLGCPHYTPTK